MIGLFNDSFLPIMDGVNVTVYNYAYWLHRAGLEVCVVAPGSPGDDDWGAPFEVLRYPSLPILGRKPYRYGLDRLALPLKSRLQKMDFSLVHAHSPFSTGRLARWVAKSMGVPFVATFHSKYRQDFQKSLGVSLIVDQVVKKIVNFYQSADEVWIPQGGVISTMREYGFEGDAVVVENGCDLIGRCDREELRGVTRTRLGVLDNEYMLLFVGQLIEQKNIPLLINALREVRDLPFKMYFVGEGNGLRDFEACVASYGLQSKVFFVGVERERERLAGYYAGADLFLFPSIYDTSGLVVKEAAALELPSLLISKSDVASRIEDGVNGFISGEDATAYGSVLRGILSNADRLRSVGIRARDTLVRPWDSVVAEVRGRYQKLIDNSRGK